MNYKIIYDLLISHAKANPPIGYCEIHHIIPKCIGGGNDQSNLVALSARQHFVAHLLLAKIHGGKLIFAAWGMSNNKKYTSRKYAWLRKRHSEKVSLIMTGRKLSKESQLKKVATRRARGGYKWSPETLEKMRQSRIGKKWSPEKREKMSKVIRKKGCGHTEDWKTLMSQKNSGQRNPFFGRKHTEESKEKIRTRKIGTKLPYKKRRPNTQEERQWRSEHNKKNGIKPPVMYGNQANKGKMWVHHSESGKMAILPKDQVDDYLKMGFVLGRGTTSNNPCASRGAA